jgi:hypothetical protein
VGSLSVPAHLYKFGANLRSPSPFDAGAPTQSDVSGRIKGEYTPYCFSGVDCNLNSGIGEIDHVAPSHCKPLFQANQRLCTNLSARGSALLFRLH